LAGIADNCNRRQTLAEKDRPGIELIVAFGDTGESHHGGIYEAANFYLRGHERAGTIIQAQSYWQVAT
jgi:hypothetical protein